MERMNKEPTYIIKVLQKIFFNKNRFIVEIYDGYATITYDKEKVAQATYNNMKATNPETKLEGNKLFNYFKKKKAEDIFELYKIDLDTAISKKLRGMSLTYEVVKGGDE